VTVSVAEDEAVVRARERVGTVLGAKYRLDRVLGVGGMAAVYAATHLRNANRVAVKILHRELATDEGLRERFLREGYAANSVEHPGTVRILDDDTAEDGSVFLVMDLLEGETLEARWERKGRRLRPVEVAHLVHQVLDVLVSAHAKGIVHRDIKPENLFLTRDRSVKVLDFGVARLLEGAASMTRAGRVFGTPSFMAPEQVLGKTQEVDAQSDLWGVGATAFTLLSGQHVHEAETPEEAMVFTATRPAPSLATAAPDVPAALVEVVDRALMLKKSDRWPNARAMQKAVEEARVAIESEPPSAAPADAEAKSVASPDGDDAKTVVSIEKGNDAVVRASSIGGVAASQGAAESAAAPVGPSLRGRLRVGAVAAAGVIAVGVLVALFSRRDTPPAESTGPSTATQGPASTASVAPTVPAAPVVLSEPAVAPDELPAPRADAPAASQASAKPPASAAVKTSPHAPAAQPPTSGQAPGCASPYTVDANGKKRWKRECL
jgi:serine/threonine-protein kinase